MTAPGLMPLEEGGRVDFARLRSSRRRRLFDAMQDAALDALVLGRPANVRFASGARQLWTAGARPFAPACVVIRSTAAVHLLSVWDEGVPPEISHDQLFGLSWDPSNLARALRRVPGLSGSARVGTDALTPLFASLLRELVPAGDIVDGTGAIWQARTVKDSDELACMAAAAAAAEAALAAMVEAARPGTSERQLLAVLAGTLAALGLPPLATDSVAFVSSADPHPRHLATDRQIEERDLVALNAGALYAGYEGGIARTIVVGAPTAAQRALRARADEAHGALVDACRAGRTGAEVRRGSSEPSSETLVTGLGLGVEPPVMGHATGAMAADAVGDCIGDAAVLVEGSVLSVQSWTADAVVGGVLQRDVVVVTHGGPQALSRFAVT